MIYRDKKDQIGPLPPTKLFLNIDNHNTGITFAWNVYKQRATKYDTKLEAETAAIQFTTRYPEFMGRLKTTWFQTRIQR